MRILISFLLVALYAAGGLAADSEESSLNVTSLSPKHQANDVPPGLERFVNEVRQTVTQRNIDALVDLTAGDLTTSFGPNQPALREFVRDEGEAFWHSLEELVDLGGSFIGSPSEGHYCLPYIYAAFPDDLDAYEYHVVVKPSVDARAEASIESAIIPLPDYAVVRTGFGTPRIAKGSEGREWARINLKSNDDAYIKADALRSPLGWRMCIQKRGGNWRITALVSGD